VPSAALPYSRSRPRFVAHNNHSPSRGAAVGLRATRSLRVLAKTPAHTCAGAGRKNRQYQSQDTKVDFIANCMIRGRLAVPKWRSIRLHVDLALKMAQWLIQSRRIAEPRIRRWLKALTNSARKSIEVASVIFVLLVMDRSQFLERAAERIGGPNFPMARRDAGICAPLISQGPEHSGYSRSCAGV